jgi:hypothetical protein
MNQGNLPSASLVCRLRPRQLRRGPSPMAGEVELENTSPEILEIEAGRSLLGHLDLVVRNAGGEVISNSFYGDMFSPLAEDYTVRLQPGEKYVGPVHLLRNVPEEKRQPGKYEVQAVFEYRGLRAASEPLTVELPAGS